jgi:hypothetical protein
MALVDLNINECKLELTELGKKYLISTDSSFNIKNFSISDDDVNYSNNINPIYIGEISGDFSVTKINDLKFKIIK